MAFRSSPGFPIRTVRGAGASRYLAYNSTQGLSFRQITAILHGIKLPAISYDLSQLPDGENGATAAQRYLNSRLRVMLLTPEHATVLVGYGRDENGVLYFVRHDDAKGRYLPVSDLNADELGEREELLVPVPGRIYPPGESTEVHARLVLYRELKSRESTTELAVQLEKGQLRVRTYVTDIAEYKRNLRSRDLADNGCVARGHKRFALGVGDRVSRCERGRRDACSVRA